MAVTIGPPWVADGPIPKAPPHNLLSIPGVLTIPDDEHFLVGIEVWPYPSDLPENFDPCSDGTMRVKPEGEGWNLPIFGPFTAALPITCSTVSAAKDGFADRARIAFEARQSYAVSYELAHGHAQPLNPFFADGNTHILAAGAAVSPDVGLAYLEDAIGVTGNDGMIHATNAVAASWNGSSGGYGVEDVNGVLVTTANRTPIAVSHAYAGATPRFGHDAATGQAWAFATSRVMVRTEPEIKMIAPTTKESMDRENNLVTFRAERGFVAIYDAPESNSDFRPAQAAVLIDWTP